MLVTPRGDIRSPLWIILHSPSEQDEGAGSLISGSEGFHFDKLINEVGLPAPYITCIEQNSLITYDTTKDSFINFLCWLATLDVRPVLIGLYGPKAAEVLCPETKNYKKPYDTKLDKWAGSLLISPFIQWPHYCVPLWPVSQFFIDWAYRDVYKFIDLGHVQEEYASYTSTGSLNPLPVHRINSNPSYSEIIDWLNHCRVADSVSIDVETIRPPRGRKDTGDINGYLYTISLAPNSTESLAFQLWNWERTQRRNIWRILNEVLKNTTIIGQNFFQFDSHYLEAYGLEPNIEKISDTRIRHHILFPELPHSLQFQTKQYTRIKYYKDEGKTWSPKQLKQLLHYNALDTLATYKIWEEQEKEFDERIHLK